MTPRRARPQARPRPLRPARRSRPPTPAGAGARRRSIRRHVRALPIEMLEPGPFQPRGPMEPAPLQELADSIREHGVLQPILVRPKPGGDGRPLPDHRRRAPLARRPARAAARGAGRGPRPRRPRGHGRRPGREPPAPGPQRPGGGRGLPPPHRRIRLTQDALGQAVGKSRSHVANTLRLLALPDRVRELLRDGALSAGHARALLDRAEPRGARPAGGGSRPQRPPDRGPRRRQAARPAPSARPPRPPSPEIAALERELTGRLGLKIAIRQAGRGGQVTIHYRDLDQLDGVIRLLQG